MSSLTLVALLPFVVAIVARAGRQDVPVGDFALMDLRVRDVWSLRHPARRRIQPLRLEPSRAGGLLPARARVRADRDRGVGARSSPTRSRKAGRRRRDRVRCLAHRWARAPPRLARVRRASRTARWPVDGARRVEPERRVSAVPAVRAARVGVRHRQTARARVHALVGSVLVQAHVGYLPLVAAASASARSRSRSVTRAARWTTWKRSGTVVAARAS